jgi:hypothetical protein
MKHSNISLVLTVNDVKMKSRNNFADTSIDTYEANIKMELQTYGAMI